MKWLQASHYLAIFEAMSGIYCAFVRNGRRECILGIIGNVAHIKLSSLRPFSFAERN